MKGQLETWSLYGRAMSMLVISCLLQTKAAIKQETVVKNIKSIYRRYCDSYSENIMEKRSKANFNHSNKNELASSFMQYVGTSYDKRMILFFDSFNYRDLGRQHTKKQLKIL